MQNHILMNTLYHLKQFLQCHPSEMRRAQHSAVWGRWFIHRAHTGRGCWGSSCLLCSQVIPSLPCLCRCCGWCQVLCGSFARGVSSNEDCTALLSSQSALGPNVQLNSRGRNQFFLISLFDMFSLECVQGRMGDRPFYLFTFLPFWFCVFPWYIVSIPSTAELRGIQ